MGNSDSRSLVLPSVDEGERLRMHMERVGDLQKQPRQAIENGAGAIHGEVLTKPVEYKLPPTRVSFESEADADLVLEFSGNQKLKIRFFDDSGREHWRLA